MRWVGRATYKKNEGWVELAWWHEVLPHLFGLRKEFTEYRFSQTTALRSTYSWKLLELLMKFEDTGWAQYTIEDFCTAMEATPKQQENFAKIRTKIIETAVRELTEKDGWVIRWEQIKAGRKVSALRFDFVHNCSDIEVKKITTHKTSTAAQQAKYDYVNIDDAIHAAPVVSNQNTTIEQSEIARAERAKLKVQADEMRSKKKLVPDAVTPSLKVDAFDINDFKDVRNFDKMISLASKIETLSKLDPKRKELEQEFFDELQKGSVLKPSPAKAKALKAAAAKALRATAKKTKPSDSVSD
jgi:plasmid replication initiation protein